VLFRRERVHLHNDVHHAAQGHRDGRLAHGRVPPVTDQEGIGAQQVGMPRHELRQGAGGFLRPFYDQLQVDRYLVTEGTQRRQVHENVALAVSGTAAVPAPVHLGQLERRGPPGGLIQRRLDVVVGVEQHGRRVRVRGRPGPEHGLTSVRHLREPGIGEPDAGEGVPHPPCRAGAFFRRELARVGHRGDGHQFRQFGAHLPHQARDAFPQAGVCCRAAHVSSLAVTRPPNDGRGSRAADAHG